jgi:hypothetical protein
MTIVIICSGLSRPKKITNIYGLTIFRQKSLMCIRITLLYVDISDISSLQSHSMACSQRLQFIRESVETLRNSTDKNMTTVDVKSVETLRNATDKNMTTVYVGIPRDPAERYG